MSEATTQVENLRILYESARKYFEEATFTRPARITDKAFRFLTLYTFTVAVIPGFVKSVLDFGAQAIRAGDCLVWIVLVGIASMISLVLFSVALILMLRVVHIQSRAQFDFSEVIETVWQTPELPQEVLVYSVSKKLNAAANENLPVDDSRSFRMKQSYSLFYTAVGVGLIGFSVVRLYLYVSHAGRYFKFAASYIHEWCVRTSCVQG